MTFGQLDYSWVFLFFVWYTYRFLGTETSNRILEDNDNMKEIFGE